MCSRASTSCRPRSVAGRLERSGGPRTSTPARTWRSSFLTLDSVRIPPLWTGLSGSDRFSRPILHPSYVRVRELIAGEGLVALVMEYVSGWDLRRHVGHSVGLQPSVVADIGLGVAEALAAAHDAGVVHCDLKPSNVLLDEPSGRPRLTDCRVARLARGYHGRLAWYGDAAYASPEVISGGPPVPATDVYALGLMLYEMLAGTPPYAGLDQEQVIAGHLARPPARAGRRPGPAAAPDRGLPGGGPRGATAGAGGRASPGRGGPVARGEPRVDQGDASADADRGSARTRADGRSGATGTHPRGRPPGRGGSAERAVGAGSSSASARLRWRSRCCWRSSCRPATARRRSRWTRRRRR